MAGRTRFGLLAAVVVIAVVAFVIAQSGGNDNKKTSSSAGSKPVQITVKGAKPVGGIKKITVKKSDRVRFAVTSDVADEIHVHGYDFMKDVAAGGTVRFDFPATISGSFVIELEKRGEQIASLAVEP